MTTAEDLALLLHDPETGRGLVDSTSLPRGLAGAVVLDLVLAGYAQVEGSGRRAMLVVAPSPEADRDPLLDALVGVLHRPVSPKKAVEKLSRPARPAVMERLVERRVLRADVRTWLGMTVSRSWPTVDPAPREALRARLDAVLSRGDAPTAHEAALVSLVHAVRAEHRLVAGKRSALRARAQEVAEGDWAGDAVRKAVRDIQAGMAAAVSAATVAGSSS